METTWEKVTKKLEESLSSDDYTAWIRPIRFHRVFAGRVELIVATMFTKNWIATNFLSQIQEIWFSFDSSITGIDLVVGNREEAPKAKTSAPKETQKKEKNSLNREKYNRLSHKLDPRMTFEHFIVGKPNEFAFAAAKRLADTITQRPAFNPLFLYGGVGLGKTHLMHSICWQVSKAHPDKVIVYLSAETFMHHFVSAIRTQGQVDFKELFRSVDMLLVDDIQFIAGKDSTQEEFFHTFNALVDQGKQVVLSADRSPSDIQGIKSRLISRMNSGVVADIHATTFELRLGILQDKVKQYEADVSDDVLEFLAQAITGNVRELEGGLMRLKLQADLLGRTVKLADAKDILHDLIRASARKIEIEDIQKKVAEHYNIKISELRGTRRAQTIARPRQVAMYLSKQLTDFSLPEIGRSFGGKDHTTVMYAVRKIEELMENNPTLAEDVRLLNRKLQN